MLNFAEQTGSGAVIVVWSFLLAGAVPGPANPLEGSLKFKRCQQMHPLQLGQFPSPQGSNPSPELQSRCSSQAQPALNSKHRPPKPLAAAKAGSPRRHRPRTNTKQCFAHCFSQEPCVSALHRRPRPVLLQLAARAPQPCSAALSHTSWLWRSLTAADCGCWLAVGWQFPC